MALLPDSACRLPAPSFPVTALEIISPISSNPSPFLPACSLSRRLLFHKIQFLAILITYSLNVAAWGRGAEGGGEGEMVFCAALIQPGYRGPSLRCIRV